MNIRGRDFNFGRCLRVSFSKYTSQNAELCVVEHAPELDRMKNIAMDITVTDRPSASSKDMPGFSGMVTIYNPNKDLLEKISGGATWIGSYVERQEKSDNSKEKKEYNATKEFYNSRLTVTVEAGYVKEKDDKKIADYHVILKGFLNGSSFYRKGTDDVLTFGVFDIDVMKESLDIEKDYKNKSIQDYVDDSYLKMFADTWDDTLKKYIKGFESTRLPDRNDARNEIRKITYEISSEETKANFPYAVDTSRISYAEVPLIDVSERDRENTDWFEIKYVESLDSYFDALTRIGSDNTNIRLVEDIHLKEELQSTIMPNGSVNGSNLAQMLDGLCATTGGKVGWYRTLSNVTRNTYIIYRRGVKASFVKGESANIKIWNYQNLLESPSISGSGIMTIKMVFNPECVCLKTIALMLAKGVINPDPKSKEKVIPLETDVVKDIAGLESELLGSFMAQSSSLWAYGNTQITGSNAVAALNKGVYDAKRRGYLFNKGFPIISVEHKLSSYGKDWTTTVKTTPVVGGFNYGSK